MAKGILVSYGVDIDAVGGWLGSYGGENSPGDISRGLFAGEVGVPRVLELFRRAGIRQTFFWPGHSVETFPDEFDACVAAGHEIGVHGYSHENPIAMSRQQESDVLDHCIDLIEARSGTRPTGYVAPWWEFSRDHQRAGPRPRPDLRPLADARRLHALLRPRRRLLDEDRPRAPEAAEWMKPLVSAARRPTSSSCPRTGTSTTCRR